MISLEVGDELDRDVVLAQTASEPFMDLFRDLIEAAPMAAFVKDQDGRYIYANPELLAILGSYMGPDWRGKTDAEMWPPEAAAQLREVDRAVLHGDGPQNLERMIPSDTGPRTVLLTEFPILSPDGRTIVAGLAVDITEYAKKSADHDRLAAAIRQATDSVVITDLDARITYVNPAFERLTGYTQEETIGQNARMLSSGLHPRSFYEAMWASISSGVSWAEDIVNRRKDGSFFTEEAVITPITNDAGAITGYVAVSRDVTRERALEERSGKAAKARELVAETIRNLREDDKPEATAQAICRQVANLAGIAAVQLLLFEVDGRATPIGLVVAGRPDSPMKHLSFQRSRQLRGRAELGPWIDAWMNRQGPPDDQPPGGYGFSSLAYAPIRHDQRLLGLLIIQAVDAVEKAAATEALPALIEFADLAGALIGRDLAARAELGRSREHIASIISRRAFQPVFQPIVDLALDTVVGFEGLTRFTDGSDPETTFAEASAVDLGKELEMVTLQASLVAAADLPPSAWLNVNASPDLILAGKPLRSLLHGYRRHLVLEVTEHSAIADYPVFRAAMAALGPNVEFAVDDAGAGFSSLRHILELRPAFVKLDRWLVSGIEADDARQAMIAGLRHFARSTGCRLIAEGIETDREFAALRSLNIHMGQGYLLGRPAAISAAQAGSRQRLVSGANG
jgi:PAS domain S-box-containing protein